MTKFEQGDRFTLGGVEGLIMTRGKSAYNVLFDGHVMEYAHGGQSPMSNNFRADWFDERAEKIEPPKPTAVDFFRGLAAGDRFTFAPESRPDDVITYTFARCLTYDDYSARIDGLRHGGNGDVEAMMFMNSDILTKLD